MHSDMNHFRTLNDVTTATLTTVLLKKGLRNVWMRGEAAPAGPAKDRRSRVHPPLRSSAGGSCYARLLGIADLHPGGDRGNA
jgi:hypothetical protein